jgi:hypothetical protein
MSKFDFKNIFFRKKCFIKILSKRVNIKNKVNNIIFFITANKTHVISVTSLKATLFLQL